MTATRIQQLDELGFEWGTTQESAWEERLVELKGFRAAHGLCLVPQTYVPNPSLGEWVHKQRTQYKLYQDGKPSSMTVARILQLEALGLEWAQPETRLMWEERLADLKDYRDAHGHCNVPRRYKLNQPLANWVYTQRYQYKMYRDGKPSTMTATRIQQLEELGFECDPLEVAWKERLAELKSFCDTHGHSLVPHIYLPNPSLGEWVATQQAQYKLYRDGSPSVMTPLRVQQLEALGFEWEARKAKRTAVTGARRQQDEKRTKKSRP
jgi:hypothetical protein